MDQQLIAGAIVTVVLGLLRRMYPLWSSAAMLRALVVFSVIFGGLAYAAENDLFRGADTLWNGVWTVTMILLTALGYYEARKQPDESEVAQAITHNAERTTRGRPGQ